MRKLFLWISAVSLLASCGGSQSDGTKISFGFDVQGQYAVQMRDGNGEMMSIDTLEIMASTNLPLPLIPLEP